MLFGLLGKLGDKAAINAAADSLGCQIYLLYRMLHWPQAAAQNTLSAGGGLRLRYCLCWGVSGAGGLCAGHSNLARKKANFPDLSHEAVNNAYPGRSQGFVQVLSTADGQLNRLNQMERNG